jgi:hypothetical protein
MCTTRLTLLGLLQNTEVRVRVEVYIVSSQQNGSQDWNQEGRHPPQKGPQKELHSGQCTGIHPKPRPRALSGHTHIQTLQIQSVIGSTLKFKN